ncbi:MAG: response regulator transcription factor [Bacteroidales bacterium]|nr:response regulator transcription factor [Bacteroidales bacterium]
MNTRILYIEDELFLGKIVKETLEDQGFDVIWETDGARVMNHFTAFAPDICVIDIMLPNIDGYSLCRQIRGLYQNLPIIFLTAKVETADLVKGFESGGTDYIRKPFSIEELIIRIKNQWNLTNGNNRQPDTNCHEIQLGKYSFYPERYELHSPSGIQRLSQRDMQILKMLCSNRNRVTDRRELLLSVWGDDSFFNSRNLDVYIRKLRTYLSGDHNIEIQTIKGRGYLFMTR